MLKNYLSNFLFYFSQCDLEKDSEIADQMKGIDILIDLLHFRAHFETSSRDNINIHESFESLIREVSLFLKNDEIKFVLFFFYIS